MRSSPEFCSCKWTRFKAVVTSPSTAPWQPRPPPQSPGTSEHQAWRCCVKVLSEGSSWPQDNVKGVTLSSVHLHCFVSATSSCQGLLMSGSLWPDLFLVRERVFFYPERLTLVLWGGMTIFFPVDLLAAACLGFQWSGLLRVGWREAKMRTFSLSVCTFAVFSLPLSLDLLTQITALSCPVCTTERSQWGLETQAIVGTHLLGFPLPALPGLPRGQVTSLCLSAASLWGQVLRKTG